jgi:hypothetical protein
MVQHLGIQSLQYQMDGWKVLQMDCWMVEHLGILTVQYQMEGWKVLQRGYQMVQHSLSVQLGTG